jgi:hypothetical protein
MRQRIAQVLLRALLSSRSVSSSASSTLCTPIAAFAAPAAQLHCTLPVPAVLSHYSSKQTCTAHANLCQCPFPGFPALLEVHTRARLNIRLSTPLIVQRCCPAPCCFCWCAGVGCLSWQCSSATPARTCTAPAALSSTTTQGRTGCSAWTACQGR